MTARSTRRIIAGLAAVSVFGGAVSMIATSTAAAAARSGSAAAAARSTRVTGASHSLQTLLANVQVFSSPSMASGVAGKMRSSGTSVTVRCWTTGLSYAGDPVWYSITAPEAGFVPAYDMAAHFAPVSWAAHCASPRFGRNYHSLAMNLKVRSQPTLSSAVLATLGSIGTATDVSCFVTGTAVLGDSVWYYATSPAPGYISGRFLNTGQDPAWGVPHC